MTEVVRLHRDAEAKGTVAQVLAALEAMIPNLITAPTAVMIAVVRAMRTRGGSPVLHDEEEGEGEGVGECCGDKSCTKCNDETREPSDADASPGAQVADAASGASSATPADPAEPADPATPPAQS